MRKLIIAVVLGAIVALAAAVPTAFAAKTLETFCDTGGATITMTIYVTETGKEAEDCAKLGGTFRVQTNQLN